MEVNTDKRKDCPIRLGNGNCLCVGGFCTAVSDEICDAVRSAYEVGLGDGRIKLYQEMLERK